MSALLEKTKMKPETRQKIEALRKAGRLVVSERNVEVADELASPPCHTFSEHKPLWSHLLPGLQFPFAGAAKHVRVFDFLPSGTTVEEAAEYTRTFIFIGAEHSAEMEKARERDNLLVFVFEPDLARFIHFIERPSFEPRGNVCYFIGDPDWFGNPLMWMLPDVFKTTGFPVFFTLEEFGNAVGEYTNRVIHLLELFYFRTFLYSLDGQDNHRGKPIRPMKCVSMYDRVVHEFMNAPCIPVHGTVKDLQGAFSGFDAIVAGAGPDLSNHYEYIRRNKSKCVVIAVNSALKPLLKKGIKPHFVVLNDTSLASGKTISDLPELSEVSLVMQAISSLGEDVFGKRFYFGSHPSGVFKNLGTLSMHGSVVTTGLSLAEHMGCKRVILIGANLCSPSSQYLMYTKGTESGAHYKSSAGSEANIKTLCPVEMADGETAYAPLNFIDVAQWVIDSVRMSQMKVVCTTRKTLLTGVNISHDSEPPIVTNGNIEKVFEKIQEVRPAYNHERLRKYLLDAESFWSEIVKACTEYTAVVPVQKFAFGEKMIAACDNNNVSYMLQRFSDFQNKWFHTWFFDSKEEATRQAGCAYYMQYLTKMSKEMQALVRKTLVEVSRLEAR